MILAIIITAVIVGIVFFKWGYETGKIAESTEYEDARKIFQQGLSDIDELRGYQKQVSNFTGNSELKPVFNMAIRLLSYGVDPKDLLAIDTIGMEYSQANGTHKFVSMQVAEAELQDSLELLNHSEKKS